MPNLHTYKKPPKEMTAADQKRLLTASGTTKADWRDHVIFSLGLGTGMREFEIAALDWPQLLTRSAGEVRKARNANRPELGIREMIEIGMFKNHKRFGGTQTVFLPPDCRRKLGVFWQMQECPMDGPVFPTRESERITTRTIRHAFGKWCERAKLERSYTFHCLRHTFCRAVLDLNGNDLTITRAAARHARITTTARYTEPGDERVSKAVNRVQA